MLSSQIITKSPFINQSLRLFQTLLHKQHKPITHHAYFKNDWLL
ncbi:hypothetical protein EJK51_1703 [Moraxella catarrhalis]|nr:hypothetical protein MCR_1659 [Moraxella catarrhalis BBH18]AZQ87602.1 hypothetical protein EJK52_1703 [Moraxella catarrhalis]AZQ91847.1 hypothetical protein EJK51_1703 [Moraxella catarrhalis]EKF83127.1 hypothetical protein MCRH_1729 [Moraxella catarrhalis RH4]